MPRKPRPLADRLWERVEKTDTCWLWTGPTTANGYGVIGAGGRGAATLRTHRVAYELLVGPIPDALHLDHLCRVRNCLRPDHLDPVLQSENNRRAFADHMRCPRNHVLPAKTAPGVRRGQCPTCKSDYDRARYQQRKSA